MAKAAVGERQGLRGALLAQHGQPQLLRGERVASLLRQMGLRDQVHPYDTYGCIYPSWAAAEAFVAANREHYGHTVHGPVYADGAIVSVIDLRTMMLRDFADGWQPTDPALPDTWTPGVHSDAA